jgi:hypothetical protein
LPLSIEDSSAHGDQDGGTLEREIALAVCEHRLAVGSESEVTACDSAAACQLVPHVTWRDRLARLRLARVFLIAAAALGGLRLIQPVAAGDARKTTASTSTARPGVPPTAAAPTMSITPLQLEGPSEPPNDRVLPIVPEPDDDAPLTTYPVR